MTIYAVTVILKSGRETVREIETYSAFRATDLAYEQVDVERVVHVQEAVKS